MPRIREKMLEILEKFTSHFPPICQNKSSQRASKNHSAYFVKLSPNPGEKSRHRHRSHSTLHNKLTMIVCLPLILPLLPSPNLHALGPRLPFPSFFTPLLLRQLPSCLRFFAGFLLRAHPFVHASGAPNLSLSSNSWFSILLEIFIFNEVASSSYFCEPNVLVTLNYSSVKCAKLI